MICGKRFVVFLFVVLAASCQSRFPGEAAAESHSRGTFSVAIANNEEDSFAWERKWLERILAESPEIPALDMYFDPPADEHSADIVIDFFSYWKHENKIDGIDISKTHYVPRENPLSARKNTTLESCIAGNEDLVRLDELEPPFAALTVDGCRVDDAAYPLVLNTGISIRFCEGQNDDEAAKRTTKALGEFLSGISKPLLEETPALTWIASAGDMMLGRNAGNILLNDGPGTLFGGVCDIFSASDLVLVNLEGALSSRGTKAGKTFTFRFEPPQDMAAAIKNAGIHAVLLVNNHSFDYGEAAFLDTITFLENAGVGAIGAGRNLAEVLEGWAYKKGGFAARVWGIGSFSQERSGWDGLEHTAEADKAGFIHARRGGGAILGVRLRQADKENDLNIVLLHGGEEWSDRPDSRTRELCTDLVQSGADLIIGSHPHIVQGFEWIEGKPVFWSLGNFVFAGMENTGGGDQGLLIHLGYCGKKLVYMELYALSLTGPRVVIAPDKNLDGFYRKSNELARSAR
ncbi:MAG: CapA family protein [Treponema sp.]|nr:CapA family protein [Treponema sp.]